MVSTLDSASRGPGSNPAGSFVLCSQSVSLHPGVNGYRRTVRET